MKLNYLLIALTAIWMISSGSLLSCGSASPSDGEPTSEVKAAVTPNATLALEIEGMVCSKGCAKVIQSALAGQEGVFECTVDYERRLATIAYDDQLVTSEQLIGLFPSIGNGAYKASKAEEEMLPVE